MAKLKKQLIIKLERLPDITVDRYKETELLGVNYKGKEVAHFQTGAGIDCELDIRLTPAVIKKEKLTVPAESTSHPDRSKNSRWIIQRYSSSTDLDKMVTLVKLAVTLR
ncbi:MAG: luciferase family protein [Granulosicoccus sp.]